MLQDYHDCTSLKIPHLHVFFGLISGNSLSIPEKYVTNGTIGDLGVVCGNEANQNVVYIAKSTPCAFL